MTHRPPNNILFKDSVGFLGSGAPLKVEVPEPTHLGIGHPSPGVLIAAALAPEQLRDLRARLEADGIPVACVQNNLQLLQAVTLRRYALALVDEDLPGMDALALCQKLTHAFTQPVPLTLRMGDGGSHLRRDYLQAGALNFMPITAELDDIYWHLHNHVQFARRATHGAFNAPGCDADNTAQRALDQLPYCVITTDARHRVVGTNAATALLAKLDQQALRNQSLSEVFAALRLNIASAWLLQKLAADGAWEGEVHVRPDAGQTQAFWLQAQLIHDDGPAPPGQHAFYLSDITHLILREHQLRWLADTDALTGLANRNLVLSRLNEAIALTGQHSSNAPAILFIDLDGFKQVNDQLGHATGDRVLNDAAKVLETSVRANDMVARIGGDEFVVLLIGADHLTLLETAQRINERLKFDLDGNHNQCVEVTCSIGVAAFPRDGRDASHLLKQADKAMYTAKRGGKNRFCFASEPTETSFLGNSP